ncbi:DNA polymerase beta superfamily protein [Cellulosimicrobium protaetiae]|uniref:Nucleotidyltransferase domain-containing protein n=1 Tax=Cellulosimicrobium protaetiae TaxID=2587808 RepID=A0A6M5UHK1_9MICO|nr:nucleotidyltransferase domain-containing protein [Cellulosimicrobium protaetiae]QJW36673.1 nucleotidyltransferase domain-containing protein [Cellulosimicrobium protaetiae]
MRAVPDSLDPAVVRRVDARLDRVVRDERVAIPLAVESGSRAWGFPSPDSDYDCRFVHVRSQADYLDPWPRRDVVETPLDAVLDVNGWDLLKAVRLLVRGNATLLEWLRSPIVYRADVAFRSDLLALAERVVVDRDALRRHYLHVAIGQRDRWWSDREVPLKKVFYAVRPAATLRWLRVRPDAAVPPMDLATLLVEGEAPDDVTRAAADLVALKAVSREMGAGAVPEPLVRFVTDELALASAAGDQHDGDRAAARAVAAASFRDLVARYGPPDAVPPAGSGALRPAPAAGR